MDEWMGGVSRWVEGWNGWIEWMEWVERVDGQNVATTTDRNMPPLPSPPLPSLTRAIPSSTPMARMMRAK